MKILLICNDNYHPGDVPIAGTKSLIDAGHSLDVITDCKDFDPLILKTFDVVIMSKADAVSHEDTSSWKTTLVQYAFSKFVGNGGGLVVTHNGTVPGSDTIFLDALIGCSFKFHPAQGPVTLFPVKPHPITNGITSFTEVDELYHLEILKEDVQILAVSHQDKLGDPKKYESDPHNNQPMQVMPSVITRWEGRGRVCVIAGGHSTDVWLNPMYQKLLHNAVQCCNSGSSRYYSGDTWQ